MRAAPSWAEIRPDLQVERAPRPKRVPRILASVPMPGVKVTADMGIDEIRAENIVAAMQPVHANHWHIEARRQDGSRWAEVYFGPHRREAEFAVRNHDETRAHAHTRAGWTPVEPFEEIA